MEKSPETERFENDRKAQHIQLSQISQTMTNLRDERFYYEPLFASHPTLNDADPLSFLEKKMNFPWWFSSMTGGTHNAQRINQNMARAVGEFGLGMGLGSIRPLFNGNKNFEDFNLKKFVGNQPFWANIGVAQIEEILKIKTLSQLEDILKLLEVDGLIIHLNLLQEFYQTEGDNLTRPVIEILQEFLSKFKMPVMIKEVGQGLGPQSLKQLMKMKIEAIEFAAFGGTNFSLLENVRATNKKNEELIFVGHTVDEMISYVKQIQKTENNIYCKKFIISGGIKTMLDGFYYVSQLNGSVFGQAQTIMQKAQGDYEDFKTFIQNELLFYLMCKQCLKVKTIEDSWI